VILRNLIQRRDSLENPSVPLSRAFELGLGQVTHTGASVTPDKALTVGTVYSAVTLIAGTVGSLPIEVRRKLSNGTKQLAETEGNRFIWGKPNNAMVRQVFWETIVGSMLLWGNAYALKIRDDSGKVTQLWPVKPDRVVFKRLNDNLEKIFTVDGKEKTQRDLWHIPSFSLNGVTGLSVVSLAREAIALSMTTEEFGAKFFAQGSTLGGVIEVKNKLDADGAARMAKEWAKKHSGVKTSHIPAILDNGATWKEIGMPLEDSQFLETRSFQVTEIARWFRTPPHLVGDVSKSTSWGTGIAEQNTAFKTYTLNPILTRIEQGLSDDTDLLPVNQEAHFNADAFLRGDTNSRFDAYTKAKNGGWYSVNDIRQLEDRNPIPGGDAYLQPLNMSDTGNTKNDPQTNTASS
jgi:HK97 family phage portal protein